MTHEVFFAQSNSFLAISSQSLSTAISRTRPNSRQLSQMSKSKLHCDWQLWSCFCGAPSLTRGRVCLLYMLLALAGAVFLGSEYLGSLVHILLPQFLDFPFRRLLRLAGSRWRYSTPPPHGLRLPWVWVWVTLRLTVSQSVCTGLTTRY
jgi:hypothetical protein